MQKTRAFSVRRPLQVFLITSTCMQRRTTRSPEHRHQSATVIALLFLGEVFGEVGKRTLDLSGDPLSNWRPYRPTYYKPAASKKLMGEQTLAECIPVALASQFAPTYPHKSVPLQKPYLHRRLLIVCCPLRTRLARRHLKILLSRECNLGNGRLLVGECSLKPFGSGT